MKSLLLILLAGSAKAIEIRPAPSNGTAITPITVSASSISITGQLSVGDGITISTLTSAGELYIPGRLIVRKHDTDGPGDAPVTLAAANSYARFGFGEFGTSSYRMLTFGYNFGNTYQPAYMGFQEETQSGQTKGRLIFGTRAVTTDTEPTTRLSIESGGYIGVGDTSPDARLEVLSAESPTAYVLAISSQSDTVGSLLGVTGAGRVAIASTTYLGTGIDTGTQLYYCAGGTFAGNVARGASAICTGGTATPMGIWVP